jgi:hypothetical protein
MTDEMVNIPPKQEVKVKVDHFAGVTWVEQRHAAFGGYSDKEYVHVTGRMANGYGFSIVNHPIMHTYPYYCEVAMLKFLDDSMDSGALVYDTPFTDDVLVFTSYEAFKDWMFEVLIWGSGNS